MSEAEFVAYEERLRRAMLGSDMAELDALIAEDLLFVGPDGALATKEEDLAAHQEGRVRFESIEVLSREFRLFEGAAFGVVDTQLALAFEGQPVSGRFRYLRVWRVREDGWQVVGGQVSAIG